MVTNLKKWSQDVCKRMGLDADFIFLLVNQDDWSFVIKANALIEAALTHALVKRLGGGDKLQSLVATLGQSRRIRWGADLGLLGKNEKNFVVMLNKLRNTVVHDVTNVDLDLVKYYKDDGERQSFVSSCSFAFVSGPPGGFAQDSFASISLKHPKVIMFTALHRVMAPLYDFTPPQVDISDTVGLGSLFEGKVFRASPPMISVYKQAPFQQNLLQDEETIFQQPTENDNGNDSDDSIPKST